MREKNNEEIMWDKQHATVVLLNQSNVIVCM